MQLLTLSEWKDLAAVIAGIGGTIAALIAICTFFFGVIQYRRSNMLKRAELYFEIENRFFENEQFRKIVALLENDDPALAEIALQDRIFFLGLYEQVAIMLNSKLMRKELAHYMFGFYAVKALESEHFWSDGHLDKKNPYWTVFRSFAGEMKQYHSIHGVNIQDVRL